MKSQEIKKLKQKAWKLFSEYIRRKHSDKNGNAQCFTCGIVKPWKELQCGHGISGRGNYILFLEKVCFPQCKSCNIFRGGNYEVFIPKLIKMYSHKKYNEWVANSRKPLKQNKSDYIRLIEDLENRLKEMDE